MGWDQELNDLDRTNIDQKQDWWIEIYFVLFQIPTRINNFIVLFEY